MNNRTHSYAVLFGRFSIFVIYFWFGLLKVLDTSPANPLVSGLLAKTLPFIEPHTFLVCFGIFEMIIGLVFLVPRWKKGALLLFVLHIVTTFMPLILLPAAVWQGFMTPTLEGQYIIKNLLLISVVIFISLKPTNELHY